MTNNLTRTEVSASQNQKEVTINESDGFLDQKLTEPLTLDFTAGDVTLTTDDWRNAAVLCTNVGAAQALNTPQSKGFLLVDNTLGANIVTVTRGSSTLEVPSGEVRKIYQDGTANGLLNAGGGGGGAVSEGDALAGLGQFVFRGAKATLNVGQAVGATTTDPIEWQTVEFDTDSFFDLSADNTIITIPSGVTKVIISASTLSVTGHQFAVERNTGGGFAEEATLTNSGNSSSGGGTLRNSGTTGAVAVSEGDLIRLVVRSTSGFTVGPENTNLSIEVIESTDSLAFLRRGRLLHVRDEQTSGTEGGGFTSGSRQTRALNTSVTNEIVGASLSANQITLPAGRYYVEAKAPAFAVNRHKLSFRDTTGAVDLALGNPQFSGSTISSTEGAAFNATLEGVFTLTEESVLELQHQAETTKATNGLGLASSFGDDEVYAEVYVWQFPELESSVSILGALLHVRDEKADTTDGGTFTSGSYETRDLNTVQTNEIAGASVSSNQITLPAGDYYVEAHAPAFDVDTHKTRLRDTTGGADLIIGRNAFSRNITGSHASNTSTLEGRFSLASTSVLELQHRSSATKASNGFGTAASFGDVEVYSEIRIWKIKDIASLSSKVEYLPAAAWQPAQAATGITPCGDFAAFTTSAGNPDAHGLPFAGDTNNETAMIEFVMPSDWDGGVLNFRINDMIPGGQTGGQDGRVWAVSAVSVAPDGNIDTAYGTAVNVTIDDADASTRQRSALSGNLTAAGTPAAGDMLFLRLDRLQDDGADDLDTDAIFLGLELTYGVA